jgi:hypothetical protein
MRPARLAVIALLCCSAVRLYAQTPIDGSSASRWTPCIGWVPAEAQCKPYSVTNEGGALVFTGEGKGKQMPWILQLRDDESSGDSRYLLVRYKAEDYQTTGGNYFLHGVEGTPGGRLLAWSDEVVSDGQWHTLAVDLAKVIPQEPISAIAFKLVVGDTGKGKLTVQKVWFADELPADAKVARALVPEAKSITFDWAKADVKQAPGWTLTPATDFSAVLDGSAMTFTTRGTGKAMRWPILLPEAIDLQATPYLSVRYKASGQLGLGTYAIWLGDDPTGASGHSTVPLSAGDLNADGAWHNVTIRLGELFKARELAIGLDCAGDTATMALDTLTFSSAPTAWPIAKVLAFQARAEAWPAGQGGLTVLSPTPSGGRPSYMLQRHLAIADWFAETQISVKTAVGELPFEVSDAPGRVPQTGTAEFGTLSLPLPANAKEVFLLTAVAAPATEPWGIDSMHPRPQEVLSEPEKVVCEVRYTTGPPDFILPLNVDTGQWGMKRGFGVHAVHPDPKRTPTELLLHDRMQTASFAILGATVNSGAPKVAEPNWGQLARGTSSGAKASGELSLQASFAQTTGLTWSKLQAAGVPGALRCGEGPVFEVEIGGKLLPEADWAVANADGTHFTVRNAKANLSAVVECVPGKANELLMRMSLHNDGPTPVTATLRFPVLRGVQIGSAADTWYLYEKRGGIINSANASFRDPLGESHPLQIDGFFNPKTGYALACMTHDTKAQHHFIRLAKTDSGGEWSPEYVERDIAPGEQFEATEASLSLQAGDWRAIFAAYRQWLATWYKAPQAKPWWERTFAYITGSGHYDTYADPKQRGNIQRTIDSCNKYIGVCDFVHLYGCWATKQYGEWGDYDHYDETVGGLEYFRGNVAKAQAAGVAVGTYQDGYLNCDKGQFSGAHAKEWAMENADQTPNYIKEYDAYNECPYSQPWREYLTSVYARLHHDFATKGLYIDEYGATDGRWICRAKDHGHNGYEIPYAGEVAMLKGIRAAVGPETALYTEYPPAEVTRQYIDGSYGYQSLWSVDQEPLAPHFIDLPRFAFPKFKQFQIIYYVSPRAGNWWLLKYPFFNGESYDLGEPNLPGYDAPAMAFQRKAIQVLCAHREAFSSSDVDPLVPTETPGVFANVFRAGKETVWTLYNANGRSVHGTVLRAKHTAGAKYVDEWNGGVLSPTVRDGFALISVDLDPKGIGCVVQRKP